MNTGLYMDGDLGDGLLLTLAYDSEKDTDAPGFRDQGPHEFYPVYGDQSVRAFDAQSSDQLYALLEKDSSHAQYGDFSTAEGQETMQLGNYARQLTGAKAHIEQGSIAANVFAAQTDGVRYEVEIPARGISGPYRIKIDGEVARNSEVVAIVTYDKERPDVILGVAEQKRFDDYSLKYFDKSIVFSRPVPAHDNAGNPQFIRITVEIESGSGTSPHWVAGANARLALTDDVGVHVSAVHSDEPGEQLALYSAAATAEVSDHGKLTAELAYNESEGERDGWAARTEYQHAEDDLELRLNAAQTGKSFDSPDAFIAAGRQEAEVQLRAKLGDRIWAEVEGFHTKDLAKGDRRTGVKAGPEFHLSDKLVAEAGLRVVDERDPDNAGKQRSAMARSLFTGLEWRPASLPRLSLQGEYEQGIHTSSYRRYSVGGEYDFDQGELYAKYATAASRWTALGPDDSTAVIGGEYHGTDSLRSFSEYRARSPTAGGTSSELASGVRGDWTTDYGLRTGMRLERTKAFSEKGESGRSVAASTDYQPPGGSWVGRVSGEWSGGTSESRWYGSLGVAWRVGDDWSMLVQDRIGVLDDRNGTQERVENRLRAGVAFRPADHNRVNALGWYEWVRQNDATTIKEDSTKHLWSLSADWRPMARLTLTGRYAGKWSKQTVATVTDKRLLQQIVPSLTYDLTNRITLGLTGSVLFEGAGDNPLWSLGAEGGYLLGENIWLSVGYNVFGYDEEDLGSGLGKGLHLRLRVKFDEDLLGWLQ